MTELPRTLQVMQAIRAKIVGRTLIAGERLPSIRRFAAVMGVSPSTVVEAYDRLVAEGVIRARPGSGFYVVRTAPALDLRTPAALPERAVDPFWVSRQSLDEAGEVLKPGCGWLPPDWLPQAGIRRALRQLSRGADSVLTDYGSALGPLTLRRILARQFAEEGLDVSPEGILLATSASQSIDLICRYLLRPEDTVLVDDPCYFNFQALLRVHKVKVIPVPFTPTGPDLSCFATALATHRPRLYITNSALHNPTGGTMTAQTAHRLLMLAGAHDLTIVEDDTFAALEPEPSPRLAVMDGLERVIRIGSFSKTLSASVRCGYVVGSDELIAALADLQVATNFGGPSPIATEIVHTILHDGSYRKHVETIRRRLSRARREVADRLTALGIEPWLMPRGGFYLWCSLPGKQDAAWVAQAALRQNVVLAPGNIFSPSQSAAHFMRFNVSQMPLRVSAVLSQILDEPG